MFCAAESLGHWECVALATTSSGYAWAMGRDDGEMTRDEALRHMRMICDATDLPVNADFEAGFDRAVRQLIDEGTVPPRG